MDDDKKDKNTENREDPDIPDSGQNEPLDPPGQPDESAGDDIPGMSDVPPDIETPETTDDLGAISIDDMEDAEEIEAIDDEIEFDDSLDSEDDIPLEDDADFIDEDWDEFDDDDLDEAESASPKKKGSLFNKAVVGIAAIAAIGVIFFQFGAGDGSSTQTSSPAQSSLSDEIKQAAEARNQAKQNTSRSREAEEQPQTEQQPKEGFLHNPDSIPDVEQIRDDIILNESEQAGARPDEPWPEADSPQTIQTSEAEPLPMPSAIEQPGSARDTVPRAPQNAQAETDAMLTAPPATGMETDTAVTGTTPPEPANDEAMQQLADELANELLRIYERLDTVLDRVDEIDDRVSRIQNEQAMASEDKTGAEAAEAMEKLEGTVNRLETKIKNLEADQSAKTKTAAAPQTQDTAPVMDSANQIKPAKKPEPASNAVNNNARGQILHDWILKAATPQEALIAKKGQSEILSVKVGETVDGVGRITAIAIENNQWVVKTTGGDIKQN